MLDLDALARLDEALTDTPSAPVEPAAAPAAPQASCPHLARMAAE